MPNVKLEAEPAPLSVDTDKAALVIIDMQRDFLEPGAFGEGATVCDANLHGESPGAAKWGRVCTAAQVVEMAPAG